MNDQQRKTIDNMEMHVRKAGQSILDALSEIKSIKEDQQMQRPGQKHQYQIGIDRAQPGADRSVRHFRGPISPMRDAIASPELPRRRKQHGQQPARSTDGAPRPRRSQPYKRQKGNWA